MGFHCWGCRDHHRTTALLFIYFRYSHSLSVQYFMLFVKLAIFFFFLKITNTMHASKAWLSCKVQRDESTKIPSRERRWRADLYALTKILFRGGDKKTSLQWQKIGTREYYSNNISNNLLSRREHICWPPHALALALLKWPICTFCTVLRRQALMSRWKSAAISLQLQRGKSWKSGEKGQGTPWKKLFSVGKKYMYCVCVCVCVYMLIVFCSAAASFTGLFPGPVPSRLALIPQSKAIEQGCIRKFRKRP